MRRAVVVLAVAAALSGVAASGAHAGLISSLLPSCGAMSQPFAQFGDSDRYCAFANNGFENGLSSWSAAGNASVVPGNEPWFVSGPGSSALDLGPGASVTSAPLPVSLVDPWVKFFARSAGVNGGLRVQVLFQGFTGNLTGILNVGYVSPGGYASWQPTGIQLSALALPIFTSTARVQITSLASSGDWLVDDAYLDPMISRGA